MLPRRALISAASRYALHLGVVFALSVVFALGVVFAYDVHRAGVASTPRTVRILIHPSLIVGRDDKKASCFSYAPAQLEELATWLAQSDCTIAAMESTGSYWKPVWNVLEDRLELILANAKHVRALPRQKT